MVGGRHFKESVRDLPKPPKLKEFVRPNIMHEALAIYGIYSIYAVLFHRNLMFAQLISINIVPLPPSSHIGPDSILSLWTRHHCTLDDPSCNQFRDLLIRVRNEHSLELVRNHSFRAAKLILLERK